MKISYNWLNDRFFSKSLPAPKKISELLTMHAFEVESIESISDDSVLDVKVLPNRSHDCLSEKGIAREISALLSRKLSYEPERSKTDPAIKTADFISLEIESGAKCYRAAKRVVVGVKVGESPDWLKKYLNAVGQKSINNIVDSANFVMLETGQPVHTFDLDKISGEQKKKLKIRNAKDGETLGCLDGKTYTLSSEALVISDEIKALDIAGIKGGISSAIDENTKNVLISACNFDPISIRKTSKTLGLRTDASIRFENGITAEIVPEAVELLSSFIEKTAGGKISIDILDIYPKKEERHSISISLEDIENCLGIKTNLRKVSDIFTKAGFRWDYVSSVIKEDKKFVVEIPSERLDLRIKEDLVEEFGRFFGYENIGSASLGEGQRAAVNKIFYYQEKIRKILVGQGFCEVYTYAFQKNGEVEVANPIASDKGFLRNSLAPAIEKVLSHNISLVDLLGISQVKVFEIGNIFSQAGEHLSLGIGVRGRQPNKRADLLTSPDEILKKVFRELSEETLPTDIIGFSGNGVAEVDLTKLIAHLPDPVGPDPEESFRNIAQYKKPSPYPFVVRDIAVFVPIKVSGDKVLKKILKTKSPLLVNHFLFDTFTKKSPDGVEKISYAFRLVFQSEERTLTDVEVNEIMDRITKSFNSESGWQTR